MVVMLAVLMVRVAGASAAVCSPHWVGSWIASPSDGGSPGSELADQTLRMVIPSHLSGQTLRLRLSNRFGSQPVTLGPVTIGIRGAGAAIVPGSLRPVTFAGARTVTIAPGRDVISDRVSLRFAAFQDLAASVAVRGTVSSPTEHRTTRQASYFTAPGSGDQTSKVNASGFSSTTTQDSSGWYFLDGVEVLASGRTGAVVTFGDSITEGDQGNSSPIEQSSEGGYPDDLQRRLISAHIPLSVLNAGIIGNRALQNGLTPQQGPSGLSRFRLDALAQAGVTDVIVLEGINDIGQTSGLAAQQLENGDRQLIGDAHAAGIKIQLGTLTPSGGTIIATYGDAAANQLRQQVNQWIRSQRLSDGVVDFDAAVRDPADGSRIDPPYDGSDHLHFSFAGYRAMANAVNLKQLRVPACTLPKLHLSISPRTAPAGQRVTQNFRVTTTLAGQLQGVRDALIQIGSHRIHTNRNGRASITLRFARSGSRRATALKTGYTTVTASINITSPTHPQRN